MNTPERRRDPRYEVQKIQGLLAFSVEAKVLNLSLSGIAVETTAPLRIRHRYSFRLGSGAGALTLAGFVRWCTLRRTEKAAGGDVVPIYESGIGLTDVPAAEETGLRKFLEEHAILDTDSRLHGRFALAETGPVEVSADRPFTVVQLSQSGMLIAADYPLLPEARFPAEVRLNGDAFSGDLRIVHVCEDEPGHYLLGVEFRDLSAQAHDVLVGFIRRELEKEEADED